MIKRILLIISLFAIAMVGGIFATQSVWPYFVERPLIDKYKLEAAPVYLTEIKEVYIQENTALINAIEKIERSIVAVRTTTPAGRTLEGSGLVVTSDGLIVTPADLVPQGSDFVFYVERRPLPYQVLKRDVENNLALVKLSDSLLQTTGFGRLDDLKAGERVFLLGKIFFDDEIIKSANEGIVKRFDDNLIYTNMLEDQILSGSPLFNIRGEVLGLTLVDKQGQVRAVPISIIREFIGL